MLTKEQFKWLSYDEKFQIIEDIYSNFSDSEWILRDLYELLKALNKEISDYLLNQMYNLVFDLMESKKLKLKETEKEKLAKIRNKLNSLKIKEQEEKKQEEENLDRLLENV